jgi:hypothetical protein
MTTSTEPVDQLLPRERPTFKTTLYQLQNVTATGEGLRGALNNGTSTIATSRFHRPTSPAVPRS